jgi:ferrous iron transport protein B
MLGLYLIGFLAAFGTASLLKSSVLKSVRTPFMLELPPYRMPSLRGLGLRLYDRSKVFLRRAGTIILGTTVVLWILATVPMVDGQPAAIESSLAGTLGRAIEPPVEPLGFNWKIAIGLITSLAAREVIVGTLGTIYGMEAADETSRGLQAALQADLRLGGAAALLVFFAFAMQCMSTVAVVRRETGGWRWPIIQFTYMTALAYVCAFAVNQLLSPSQFKTKVLLRFTRFRRGRYRLRRRLEILPSIYVAAGFAPVNQRPFGHPAPGGARSRLRRGRCRR